MSGSPLVGRLPVILRGALGSGLAVHRWELGICLTWLACTTSRVIVRTSMLPRGGIDDRSSTRIVESEGYSPVMTRCRDEFHRVDRGSAVAALCVRRIAHAAVDDLESDDGVDEDGDGVGDDAAPRGRSRCQRDLQPEPRNQADAEHGREQPDPVSYTHLTLPTILRV